MHEWFFVPSATFQLPWGTSRNMASIAFDAERLQSEERARSSISLLCCCASSQSGCIKKEKSPQQKEAARLRGTIPSNSNTSRREELPEYWRLKHITLSHHSQVIVSLSWAPGMTKRFEHWTPPSTPRSCSSEASGCVLSCRSCTRFST
jgi:hypothetical protein